MLREILKLLSFVVVIGISLDANSQCSNFSVNWPAGVFTTSSPNWQTIDNCVYGGDFTEFFVVEGGTYRWRSCTGTGFDSEITLWDEGHTTVLGYEEDNCSSIHGNIICAGKPPRPIMAPHPLPLLRALIFH